MHRIDVPSATVDNKFTEGSPAGGIPATTVAADWLNDLQENVCEVIEGAGITLVKGNSTQLIDAIQQIAGDGTLPQILNTENGYLKLPVETAGGTPLILIVNWLTLSTSSSTSGVFPQAYTTINLFTGAGEVTEASGNYYFAEVANSSLTGFTAALYGAAPGSAPSAGATLPVKYLSIGI